MKINFFKKKWSATIIFCSAVFLLLVAAMLPQEGMYPLSEISKLDLMKAGLKIDASEIYNPEGISLIDALVKLPGCTGSFVSSDGLIITNHHCSFGLISRASTPEENHLQNGFTAMTKADEIPAPGYHVRILESYEDVSEKVLGAVADIEDLVERSKAITAKMDEIESENNDPDNFIDATVSEMFIGQTYILFRYRVIKDVRLVYAPPRAIGEFGGETDNWVWPRHTGDFSFLRAYVAPDGSTAEYAEENVPFHPKRFLKVNPNGVQDGDFTFILGYPGRTYRHRPSQFLEYQEDYQLPYISKLYGWMIEQYEELSANDESLKLKYAPLIKGLANTKKNYEGKLLGLKRLNLVEKKQIEEELLQNFIQESPELKEKYGSLLTDFEAVYEKMFVMAEADLWLSRFRRFSGTFKFMKAVIEHSKELEKPEDERKDMLTKQSRIKNFQAAYDPALEKRFLIKMFGDIFNFTNNYKIEALEGKSLEEIEILTNEILSSKLFTPEKTDQLLTEGFSSLVELDDPVINFYIKLYEQENFITEENNSIDGALSKLMPMLTDVKKKWKQTAFVPDANSTLRLTYGNIKGYYPRDAVYYSPISTLDGVIDKNRTGIIDYEIPEKLKELYDKKDFGKFFDEKLGSVPTGILYNMDTTGGNSGSPIMNAYGEIIGVNFDRAYEATINDYAWNKDYSRSIGVDIRYVLWVTQKIGGADHILKELGVEI